MLDKELILRRELEVVSSERLRALLHKETEKDVPDDDLVLTILHILEDREPDELAPVSDREEAAWTLFRKRVRARKRRPHFRVRSLAKAAVLLLVVGLLFVAIPQQAEADNWWDWITGWTDDFFGFFREEKGETFNLADYEFRTDNPGLQQVYDAVVELGVTEPVVPMWIPDGYEIASIVADTMLGRKTVVAWFEDSKKSIMYQVTVLSTDKTAQYYKDDTSIITFEKHNTTYNIMRNDDIWVVAWTNNNIECSIAVDCQEDVLYEIITSIYR